ncbi:MAG: thioredoxin-dependent thiol peroxidase [Bacteroidales bacterium]|nr:thioredoxin-dependent thiol peroxidase [Bacteroidales bacterium]
MVQVGNTAPDIQLPDQNGNIVSLRDYAGKKIILYFYPKDDTPGCTAEACSFRDNYQSLLSKGFVIIGISADDTESHKKFAEKYKLPFPLVADPERKVIKAYGAWGEKVLYGKRSEGILRKTFVIDEQGKILHIIEKVDTEHATEQILKLFS